MPPEKPQPARPAITPLQKWLLVLAAGALLVWIVFLVVLAVAY